MFYCHSWTAGRFNVINKPNLRVSWAVYKQEASIENKNTKFELGIHWKPYTGAYTVYILALYSSLRGNLCEKEYRYKESASPESSGGIDGLVRLRPITRRQTELTFASIASRGSASRLALSSLSSHLIWSEGQGYSWVLGIGGNGHGTGNAFIGTLPRHLANTAKKLTSKETRNGRTDKGGPPRRCYLTTARDQWEVVLARTAYR